MDHETTLTRISCATWFFFDLDDTLHYFRRTSSAAVASTLSLILTHHPHLNLPDLQASYTRILHSRTTSAFTDGKTSHEYRAERFRTLLADHNVQDDQLIGALLECYEQTLMQNLELKDGAAALLQTVKANGKHIAVVTEGPQDAQERTIEALGIARFVDYLATTNGLGVAKVDGMFGRVLQRVGARAEEVVVVGDSWERDVVPAKEAGLLCVWLDEQGEETREEGVVRIRNLEDLKDLMSLLRQHGWDVSTTSSSPFSLTSALTPTPTQLSPNYPSTTSPRPPHHNITPHTPHSHARTCPTSSLLPCSPAPPCYSNTSHSSLTAA